MSQVLSSLDKLRLNCLSDDWVEGAYYSEFLEFGEIPNDYMNILYVLDIQEVFQDIISCLDNWLTNDVNSEEDKSWAFLSHQLKHKNLLALLAYYIDHGSKNILTKEDRNDALMASQLYYKLLTIPGYKAYDIYHSQLFAHSLICLSFPKVLCENEDKYFNKKELINEVNSVITSLKTFVEHLRDIIDTLHLGPNDMNFEDILVNLLDITGGAIVNKLDVDKVEFTDVTRVIYVIIEKLLLSSTGEPNAEAIQLLFKCLLPKLLAVSTENRSANVVRASYVMYIACLLGRYGKPALIGFSVLLQHLCYASDGLERAEIRNSRVMLIDGLMNMLPPKLFKKFVKWLITLSTTFKISHRQIGLELLSKLLALEPEKIPNQQDNDDGESTPSNEDENSQDLPGTESMGGKEEAEEAEAEEGEMGVQLMQRKHSVCHARLLRAVYERVHDVSGPLRARALAILSDSLDSPHPHVQDALKELNGDCEVSRLMAVSARCICDDRALVRRAAIILLQRLLSSPIHTRTIDNSTEDMKINMAEETVNIIADVPSNAGKSGTDEDPKSNETVVTSNAENMNTEEADRKENNNEDNQGCDIDDSSGRPVVRSDFALLVGACRDGTVMVRTSAIAAVGELVALRPSAVAFDAFLSGPVHHLSDSDPKVSELVASQIQNLLLNRLKVYIADVTEDCLPWMFLESIIRHNMRRHLQKACTLLSKTGNCINHRLVDILSTHLGAVNENRDLQCLVLLTSIAKHVEYSDPSFVLEYYNKLDDEAARGARGVRGRDGRVEALALELCGAWARWAAPAARAELRARLVRRLAADPAHECRIACASLAAQLDPSNLKWATELMQLSERRALAGGGVAEWVRAADLSLVAPEPPSSALLHLFLSALADPPPGWSVAERAACVAGAGRLCVRARPAAAACAPPLGALLRDAAQPSAARLNALRALADICTRYTCIVDPLLGDLCGCLAAGAPAALRRGAVRALTRLLLAGFLRLRTPLYYTYCALLADDDYDVREPVEYYVTQCLAVDVLYHHFVDCVIHYSKEDALSFDERQLIYDVMLQRMSPVQLLNTQCRLAREVLERAAGAAEEACGGLPPALHTAALDCIALLCGPRMKLPKKPANAGDAADLEDLQERITTNIVSHKMKSTVAEVVVPAVLRLYAQQRTRGGQLVAYLVRLATDLLTDYRQEIEELIDNDEELVERVHQFQETIGLEPSFGNARNLVASSAPPEPDTPRAPRKRPPRNNASQSPRKRVLRI